MSKARDFSGIIEGKMLDASPSLQRVIAYSMQKNVKAVYSKGKSSVTLKFTFLGKVTVEEANNDPALYVALNGKNIKIDFDGFKKMFDKMVLLDAVIYDQAM